MENLTHPSDKPLVKQRWCLCWKNNDVNIQPSGEGVSNQSQQLFPFKGKCTHKLLQVAAALEASVIFSNYLPRFPLLCLDGWIRWGSCAVCLGRASSFPLWLRWESPEGQGVLWGWRHWGEDRSVPSTWLILSVVTHREAGSVQKTMGIGFYQLLVHKWLGKV